MSKVLQWNLPWGILLLICVLGLGLYWRRSFRDVWMLVQERRSSKWQKGSKGYHLGPNRMWRWYWSDWRWRWAELELWNHRFIVILYHRLSHSSRPPFISAIQGDPSRWLRFMKFPQLVGRFCSYQLPFYPCPGKMVELSQQEVFNNEMGHPCMWIDTKILWAHDT